MISVVIPLYNKEKQIGNTLRTVLNQTFQDFEIVVVNDGSTDNSTAEVERFHDQRIRLVHQANAGVSAARNRGIEESKYDLIAFLDADDEWKPSYLETQHSLYKKYPECSVFACNYESRDGNGNVRPTIIRKLPFQETDGILSNYFEVASCSHPPICSISIMVKKSALKDIGGFPVGIKSGEDLMTWARLACNYKIAYNRIPLCTFIQAPSHSISKTPTRQHDAGDPVGQALIALLGQYYDKKNLRKYISLWYKMRTSVFIRMYNFKESWRYGIKSIRYNPLNLKVYLMLFMTILPKPLQELVKNNYHE